jgi:hypothetical protein
MQTVDVPPSLTSWAFCAVGLVLLSVTGAVAWMFRRTS